MTKKPTLSLMIVLALVAVAATAYASPSADTALSYGYDADELRLIYNVSDILQPGEVDPADGIDTRSLDCRVAAGDYVYELNDSGDTVSGLFEADTTDPEGVTAGDEVEFGYDEASENSGPDPLEPARYSDPAAADCALLALGIQGPEGQVTHGAVVSSFVHALKAMGIRGGGCLVRTIAKSDFGKDGQMLTPEEAQAALDALQADPDRVLDVTLQSVAANCNRLQKAGQDPEPGKADAAHGPEWKHQGYSNAKEWRSAQRTEGQTGGSPGPGHGKTSGKNK